MDNQFEVVFVSNCGLLIKSKYTKILIDCLYHLDNSASSAQASMNKYLSEDIFTPIPSGILNQIINGLDDFRDIDCLLFTHCHNDHFSCKETIECIEKNNIGNIFLPKNDNLDIAILKEKAGMIGVKYHEMNLPFGTQINQIIKDINIKYFRTAHSGKEFTDIEHYCFLISNLNKNIYVSGDADYNNKYQYEMIKNDDVAIAFFNPLYFHQQSGRNLINLISPRRVVMYHVPFEEDDIFSFRKYSQRAMDRFRRHLPPCEIVSKELQSFYV